MNRCEEVLMHHGTKGMKWGVRRYQNPDGTLTAAGIKRYTQGTGKVTEKGAKRMLKDYKTGLTAATKDAVNRSVISDNIVKKSEKELDKSKKKYEKAMNKGSSSIAKKRIEYELHKDFHIEATRRKEKDFAVAKALTDELAEKFGSKTINSLYDKNGRFKDNGVETAIVGGVEKPAVFAPYDTSLKAKANDIYKESYKDYREQRKKEQKQQKIADLRESIESVERDIDFYKEMGEKPKELETLKRKWEKEVKKLNK